MNLEVTMKPCKVCGQNVRDVCSHQACLGARSQGYCSYECQRVSYRQEVMHANN